MAVSVYRFEFLLNRVTNRTAVRGLIFGNVAANLTDMIYRFPLGDHVINGLFIKLGMPAFNITRMGKPTRALAAGSSNIPVELRFTVVQGTWRPEARTTA